MRRSNDAYYSPANAATELLQEIGPLMRETTYGTVCDPAAGRGALLDAVALELPDYTWQERIGYEIDPQSAAYMAKHPHNVVEGDFLKLTSGPAVDLFIANPPFSLAQQFVTKMLADRGPYTTVACLLRLGFLGSAKRHAWWKANPPDAIRVLSNRPSFTGDGHSDNSEYGWLLWTRGLERKVDAFGWYGSAR